MSDEFEKWWESNPLLSIETMPNKDRCRKAWDARGVLESAKEKRFGCHADSRLITVFLDCVLDYPVDEPIRQIDCLYYRSRKLSKTDCPYWKPIED